MKKLYTLVAFALLANGLRAQQQLPNNSFENWSADFSGQEAPDNYVTSDVINFGASDNVMKSTEHHTGQYSVEIKTHIAIPDTFIVTDPDGNPIDTIISPGVTVGSITLGDYSVPSNGMAFTGHPVKLRFWAKTDVVVGDTAFVVLSLRNHSGTTPINVGVAGVFLTGSAGWTQYESNVLYLAPDPADSLYFTASFVTNQQATDSSFIYLDDVQLVYGAVGVEELAGANTAVYPNPSRGIVYVNGPADLRGATVTITDVTGRTVQTFVAQAADLKIDIAQSGLYFVNAVKPNGETLLRKKISVQ